MPQLLKLKSKNESGLKIRAKSKTAAEIIIYAPIGPASWFEETVSAKQFSEELGKLEASVNEITVRINSPGGDVFDGYAIYNRLKQHKAKVIVYIDGIAASIASIIALAGDEVYMGDAGQYMIHLPWTMAYGNRMELENVANRLADIEEQMISVYKAHSNLDRSEIRAMLEAETFMDADTAIKYGFITAKMEDSLPIAASMFNHAWIKHAPKNYNSEKKFINSEIDKLKKKIEETIARK